MSTINIGTSSNTAFKVESDTTGALLIKTGAGLTTAVTVNASQNVGVGTTSPSSPIHVVGNSSGSFLLGGIRINDTNNSSDYFIGGVASGGFQIATAAGATRVVIDASGNLCVGTDSTITVGGVSGLSNFSTASSITWAGVFQNTNAAPYGVSVRYGTDTNGVANEFFYCVGNATMRASFRSNGGLANYSANDVNLSDRREKTNFSPAKDYLNVLCQIPVQTFNYIDQNLEGDPGLTLGVVAQDVQAVAPELVMESNWGTADEPKMRLSIYQTDLQYAMLKAIQELAAEVALLKGNQ